MTFLAGWRLAFLVVPLALLVAYLVLQRMRPRYVARFTDVDLLASVAPRRPGWQRHVGAGLLLLTLVALVIGFARPATVTRTPKQRATVMLTLDTSGSMAATDVSPSRLEAAKAQALTFVGKLPAGIEVGVIQFASTASVLVSPTTDRASVDSAIDGLQANGGTATADAISLAVQAIKALPVAAANTPAPAVVVLLSDGTPTLPQSGAASAAEDAAKAAAASHIAIDTIAFGTSQGVLDLGGRMALVPSDPATMAAIAEDSGGTTFTATSGSELQKVYDSIGRAVGYDTHTADISVWFTGLGLLLAAAAATAGLVWAQRLL